MARAKKVTKKENDYGEFFEALRMMVQICENTESHLDHEEILAKLEGKKYTIQRSKGLGENDADMMSKTTMNPATRRLIQVNPTDEERTRIMFETLLGDDIVARKQFIAENGYKYMDIADF